jgi:hypothetical protein
VVVQLQETGVLSLAEVEIFGAARSASPSLSAGPSSTPSLKPSTLPSSVLPSQTPSRSAVPSFAPTDSPSLSALPSQSPSLSALPSQSPSRFLGCMANGIVLNSQSQSALITGFSTVEVPVSSLDTIIAGRVNMARVGNVTATQSSISFGASAGRAVDGNTNQLNFRSITHTGNEYQSWWELVLDDSADIQDILLYNRMDCCMHRLSNFAVQLLDENCAPVTESIVQPAGAGSIARVNIPSGAEARVVVVQLQETGVLSLAEVEIYGAARSASPSLSAGPTATPPSQSPSRFLGCMSNGIVLNSQSQSALITGSSTVEVPVSSLDTIIAGRLNIARVGNVTATQSSISFGAPAGRAVDGNTNGIFYKRIITHTGNEYQSWWELVLDDSADIEDILLYNRMDCCMNRLSNFAVQLLDENCAPVTESIVQPAGAGSIAHVNIQGGAGAQVVVVQLQETGVLSLAEVEIYGDASL